MVYVEESILGTRPQTARRCRSQREDAARRSGSGASLRGVKTVLLHALPLDGHSWDKVAGLLEGDVLAPTLYGLGDTTRSGLKLCSGLRVRNHSCW